MQQEVGIKCSSLTFFPGSQLELAMTQHALGHLQNLRRGGNGNLCALLRAGPRLSNLAKQGPEAYAGKTLPCSVRGAWPHTGPGSEDMQASLF